MKKTEEKRTSEEVLGKLDKIMPGFRGFFKKVEGSKIFGPRIAEIRKKIERRFGGAKK